MKMARGARNVMHAQVHVNHFGSLDIDWDARRVVVGLRRAEAAQGRDCRKFFRVRVSRVTNTCSCVTKIVSPF